MKPEPHIAGDPPLKGSFTLADGTAWAVAAGDESSVGLVDSLAKSMRLSPCDGHAPQLLIIRGGIPHGAKPPFLPLLIGKEGSNDYEVPLVHQILPVENNIDLADQLMELSLIFSSQVESRGGLLIHGGLTVNETVGIILAGPSDVGKTTTCNRLPHPWVALSDDCTLIVKGKDGRYHGHPWPTWSDYLYGNMDASWDVQQSVPLQAIFLLEQSQEDRAERLGDGHAICLLNETAEQAWWGLATDYDNKDLQAMRLQRFNNICELIKEVPSFMLHVSKRGKFWKEIDGALRGG